MQSATHEEGAEQRENHVMESTAEAVRGGASAAMGGARAAWRAVQEGPPTQSLRAGGSTLAGPAALLFLLLLLATRLLLPIQSWLKVRLQA